MPPLRRRFSLRLAALLAVLAMTAAGCASSRGVRLRSGPQQPIAERLNLLRLKGEDPSDRTQQVLRRYVLDKEFEKDPLVTMTKLHQMVESECSPEVLYALAEVSYLAGKRYESKDQKHAIDCYGSAVIHSYRYLFDEQFALVRNPYDPQFRGACELYNSALEKTVRAAQEQEKFGPGTRYSVGCETHVWDVEVVNRSRDWHTDEFERFEFVSDYELVGLTNHYRTFGLGVPLIAVRREHENQDAAEQFYPEKLSVPVTAFLRVIPGEQAGSDGKTHRRVLMELWDPLEKTDIEVAGLRIPLESDLSTPLAYFLDEPNVTTLATLGLLNPDQSDKLRGLYMPQPYEAGKIPVIMVHGLWSDPTTWFEMYNDLRSQPELRENYQFWLYFYPTGQPFWISATEFRADLTRMREVLDPQRRNRALGEMVLVGHSMGGLVSRLQTLDSGNDFWHIVSDKPFGEVQAEPELRSSLEKFFFFHPSTSIKRVVTIGTPHRGSKFANGFTEAVARKLIDVPQMITNTKQRLLNENPEFFRDESLLGIKTSIDSLAPDSPFLPVMLSARRGPWVRYHNIVGVLEGDSLAGKVSRKGDGVVSYESAHLDDVESEIVVPADHIRVHAHPRSVLEMRRILRLHLHETRLAWQAQDQSQVQQAAATAPTHQHRHPMQAPASGGYIQSMPAAPSQPAPSYPTQPPAGYAPDASAGAYGVPGGGPTQPGAGPSPYPAQVGPPRAIPAR